jgi:hypothetical protein
MKAAERLQWLLGHIPPRLSTIGEEEFSHRPATGKWSKKEILGHLIDSAANNHHRFIRAQLEAPYEILPYAQNEWVELNRYQHLESNRIVHLWETYNRHLLEIIRHIPEEKLAKTLIDGEETVTLGWLIVDYVAHIEHHLNQITDLS